MIINYITMSLHLMADSSGAVLVVKNYVTPTMQILTSLAAIASIFFIVYGGILYMTSSGRPEKLELAKHVLKNAMIGLVIVLGAGTLTAILSGAMPHGTSSSQAVLPSLVSIEPTPASNGLIDVLINAITGLLNVIIQAIAAPFLGALDFFTKSTPLMSQNPSVFNLWLAVVGITDALFVIIVALLGFHVMSAATFGLDEIEFRHLLPRIGLTFLLLNTSIFVIDGVIELSNVLITAIGHVSGSGSVWETLTAVLKESGGQGVAALLIMLVFIVLSFILLVYYVGRLVTLFIGAVLSPLIILIWLVPGFRDFSETAMKTYLTTIFVLFVHVVILQLAASLFTGMSTVSGGNTPNDLMSMAVGLAAVIALLKTQGVMMQFSYVSLGARSTRQLGSQFINGISYLGGRSKAAVSAVSNRVSHHSSVALSGSSRRTSGGSRTPQKPMPTVTVTRIRAPSSTTSGTLANPAEHLAVVTPISNRQSVNSNKITKKEDKAA